MGNYHEYIAYIDFTQKPRACSWTDYIVRSYDFVLFSCSVCCDQPPRIPSWARATGNHIWTWFCLQSSTLVYNRECELGITCELDTVPHAGISYFGSSWSRVTTVPLLSEVGRAQTNARAHITSRLRQVLSSILAFMIYLAFSRHMYLRCCMVRLL